MSKLDWFAALHEGNSLKINDLLDEDEGNELLFMWPDESEAERIRPGWKGCNAMHVAVKQGCSQLVKKIIDKSVEDYRQVRVNIGSVNMSSQRSNMIPMTIDPCECLRDMILAFEGNCKLDTIAIALLNGDRDVTWLLAEALLVKCRTNPYGIELGAGRPVPSAIDDYKLERIREITKEVLEKMGDSKDRVVQYYTQQCEFNFLPMAEYLFLALCSYRREGDYTLPAAYRYKEVHIRDSFEILYLIRCRVDIVRGILKEDDAQELLVFLFELKDGRGRTALHVGVDHLSIGDLLLLLGAALSEDGFAALDELERQFAERRPKWPMWSRGDRSPLQSDAAAFDFTNTRDRVGRTPLHRAAAAFDFPWDLREMLLEHGADVDLSFEFEISAAICFVDVSRVSARNGFTSWFPSLFYLESKFIPVKSFPIESLPITATHLTIFNPCRPKFDSNLFLDLNFVLDSNFGLDSNSRNFPNRPNRLKSILQNKMMIGKTEKYESLGISLCAMEPYLSDVRSYLSDSRSLTARDRYTPDEGIAPFALAALVGNISYLQSMIQYEEEGGEIFDAKDVRVLPGLHLAAAVGDSLAIQTILNRKKFDLMKRVPWWSRAPATAMHAAVGGWPEIDGIGKNLLHVVNFRDGWCKKVNEVFNDNNTNSARYSRQACVNLLLQAGASVWDTFGRADAPKPGPGTSPEFRAWWSERLERETQEMKTSLTTAANAISVTAALVATASYIGPLQPPMGYGDDHLVQVGKLPVKLFIIFDTLAFYVALSAIVLAMIPSLPMPTESVQSEGKRARKSVLLAVSLLVISLVCILVAFAAASIAIVSNDGSWNHGGVTISTVAVGGFICILAIGWFVRRLLRLVKSLVLISPDRYTTLIGYLLFSFSEVILDNLSYTGILSFLHRGRLNGLFGGVSYKLKEYVKKHH